MICTPSASLMRCAIAHRSGSATWRPEVPGGEHLLVMADVVNPPDQNGDDAGTVKRLAPMGVVVLAEQ
jgi:hypothetical protein